MKIRTASALCWNYVGLSWKKNFAKPYKILTHSAYSDNFYFQFFYWLSEWVEILWGFMKFVFTQLLIIAAFYLSVCVRHLFTVIVYAIRPLKIELIYGLCSKCYIGGARFYLNKKWIGSKSSSLSTFLCHYMTPLFAASNKLWSLQTSTK